MDGSLSLHEILHHTHVKKHMGVILKLDFEKAYNKVNWEFLLSCHRARGFCDKWCDWIKSILHNGTVCVLRLTTRWVPISKVPRGFDKETQCPLFYSTWLLNV